MRHWAHVEVDSRMTTMCSGRPVEELTKQNRVDIEAAIRTTRQILDRKEST